MSVDIRIGDCRDVLPTLAADSVDACVTDPPYELKFMGQDWDGKGVAWDVATWRAVFRVLKPGAHLLAFGGTRTYHRMACAVEDAGFEIRDQIAWLFGSGFPKSHNLSGDWDGWGTALKPAVEPVVVARKPLVGTVAANVAAHGTGALNIDGCRVAYESQADLAATRRVVGFNVSYSNGEPSNSLSGGVDGSLHRRDRSEFDPGKGRWPANVCHDGSDEVLAGFPRAPGQQRAVTGAERAHRTVNAYGTFGRSDGGAEPRGDCGSAARFFYCAKADADDRCGSKHPTVKPVAFMRWLVRLVTPPSGLVLDPFAGTGTTGVAAIREGCSAILIEQSETYAADIRARLDRLSGADTPLFAEVSGDA